jgi:hypothetical protein
VSNKPAQPHQKRSIVGGESVKYFEFGIAVKSLNRSRDWDNPARIGLVTLSPNIKRARKDSRLVA